MDERWDRLTRLAASRHGHVTRADAAACGYTRRATQSLETSGRVVPLTERVLRLPGTPDNPLARLWAAILDSGPVAVISRQTAAWLWDLPGFDADPPHVTRPKRATSHRPSPLAVVHETRTLALAHLRVRHGLPVTSPARTLCDLAAVVHSKRLERAIDTAMARRLVTAAELWQLLEELAAPGRKGVRALREVLAGLVPGTESELEARFRDLLRRHGLPQPERQVVLGSADEQAGRVDCLFRTARLVVELDGRPYHSSRLDRLEDGRRDLVLLRGGYRVLRLTWHHVVERQTEVVATLQELLSCAA